MTRVLIVDDSLLVRQILAKGLGEDPEIEVVGTAADVYEARDLIVYKKPDVITLDVELPRMNGVEFLKRLMPQYPLPVVMVSAMTGPGANTTLEALEAGAVDFVLKPSTSGGSGLRETIRILSEKVKAASTADVGRQSLGGVYGRKASSVRRTIRESVEPEKVSVRVIAIGASTGGTVALRAILQSFPADMPPTLIVQHMPAGFTKMFAQKLNSMCAVEVREAENQDRLRDGLVLIAPGDYHMRLVKDGKGYLVDITQGAKVSGHRPSVDALFHSVALCAGSKALGVILTGMGADGADGLLAMHRAGARTVGQDQESSVIYGMPQVAYQFGAVDQQVPLHRVTDTLIDLLHK